MARASRKSAQAAPRLTLEEAFHRLLPPYRPHDVCENINEAIRRGRSRLWCNGNLVPPQYFRDEGLYVQAESDPDGRWRCTIKAGRMLPLADQEYRWEIEPIEMSELPRRGPPRKHEWSKIAGQIAKRCVDARTGRVRVPKRESDLIAEVRDWSDKVLRKQPPDSDLAEYVKDICAALREVQRN